MNVAANLRSWSPGAIRRITHRGRAPTSYAGGSSPSRETKLETAAFAPGNV